MNKKQAYEEKLKSQLDEWSAEIDLFKAKAEKADAATKVKYYETIDNLLSKKTIAAQKLHELQNTSDDAWTDLKEGLDSAWKDLGTAVKSAFSRFK